MSKKPKENINPYGELESVPSSDLFNELRKRFSSCMFVMSSEAPSNSDRPMFRNDIWSWGSYSDRLGLLRYAELNVEQAIHADTCDET